MEQQMIIRRCLMSAGWILLLVILAAQPSRLTLQVFAQEPTAIPTPTPANTPTAAANTPTPLPATTEPTPVPTLTTPLATPNGRFVDFRVDDDEIEAGECVRFSWIVKGDIGIVEFNEINDNKDAILVSAEGTQEACPEKETAYELIVTWLDNSKGGRGLTVKIKTGDDSERGNGGGSNNQTTVPGTFVAVTPILVQTSPTPGSAVTEPPDIFSAARVLPETGRRSISPPKYNAPDLSASPVGSTVEQPSVSTLLMGRRQIWSWLSLFVIGLTLGWWMASARKGAAK